MYEIFSTFFQPFLCDFKNYWIETFFSLQKNCNIQLEHKDFQFFQWKQKKYFFMCIHSKFLSERPGDAKKMS